MLRGSFQDLLSLSKMIRLNKPTMFYYANANFFLCLMPFCHARGFLVRFTSLFPLRFITMVLLS